MILRKNVIEKRSYINQTCIFVIDDHAECDVHPVLIHPVFDTQNRDNNYLFMWNL